MFNFNNSLPIDRMRDLPPDELPWTPSGMPDPRLMQASYSPNPPPSGIQLNGPAPRETPMLASQLQQSQQMPQQQQVDPRLSYINDVLGQYGETKQKQQDTGGLIAQILGQRFQPTGQDTSRSLLNSSLNNSYLSPQDAANSRAVSELAPYTTALGFQEQISKMNAPLSDQGKLAADLRSGRISQGQYDSVAGKNSLAIQLEQAKIDAMNALTKQRSSGSGGAKAPMGYRYAADGQALEAIPGGPATKLSPEAAAKIGAVETSLGNMKNISTVLLNNKNPMAWAANMGEVGNARRQIRASIEAALRAMSGAAVPESEVSRYENLYSPNFTDRDTTKAQKLAELGKFLSSTSSGMKKGRTVGDDAAINGDGNQETDFSGASDDEILMMLGQ